MTSLFGTTTSYVAIGSGFFPDVSKLEGEFKDRLGNPLHTLQDFQAGKAPFVSVAMDADNGPPLGTRLSIESSRRWCSGWSTPTAPSWGRG